MPTADVISDYPDRQVLVIGDTIVAHALALLLRRTGYDPLFVTGQGQSTESQLTFLCPAAYRVLHALGAGEHLRDNGVALERIAVQRVDSRGDTATTLSSSANAERTAAVLARTKPLKRALEPPSPNDLRRHERCVEELSQTEDGVAVEFEDGIREWFDVVVDASGADPSIRSDSHIPPRHVSLTQYETTIDGGSDRNYLREDWYPNALVQYLPRPDSSGTIQRVTLPDSDSRAALNHDCDGEPRIPLAEFEDELTEHERMTVRQTRLSTPDLARDWWGNGRVVFCGPSAYPVAPASGCRASFGIGDALAFVSELTHETRSPTEIVDAYVTRRVDRFETLRETAEAARTGHDYPPPDTNQTSLGGLALFRTVALGSFLDTSLSPLRLDALG